jgi:peroxiredoxin
MPSNVMRLEPGARAPDFTVRRSDGEALGLRDFQGRPLLLVFLRHLA